MITRAQAEALLTLAESLEVCTDLNIGICPAFDGSQNLQFLDSSRPIANVSALTGMKIRLALNSLVPNLEAPQVDKNCYWCFGDGITHPEQGVTYGGKRCAACKSADARGLPKQES